MSRRPGADSRSTAFTFLAVVRRRCRYMASVRITESTTEVTVVFMGIFLRTGVGFLDRYRPTGQQSHLPDVH